MYLPVIDQLERTLLLHTALKHTREYRKLNEHIFLSLLLFLSKQVYCRNKRWIYTSFLTFLHQGNNPKRVLKPVSLEFSTLAHMWVNYPIFDHTMVE